ncbi:MAG: lysine--tRNA ligase [Chitinophagales bacterium]|nr:lysine--tRNA ligase [Chitinophagales bacterium]
MNPTYSEQELIRRNKRQNLIDIGIDPYPAAQVHVSHKSKSLKEVYTLNPDSRLDATIAGRILTINDKGKVLFIKIQDEEGLFQLYVKRDDVCPEEDKSFFDQVIKHLDLGDIISAQGYVFTTKMGEVSLHTTQVTLLSKSVKPLPVVKKDEEGNVYDDVVDPEVKYRQRYVDLILHPEVKTVFQKRAKIFQSIREFLNANHAIEVDTPVLQNIPGGASAKPFLTHHNALDMPMYLRIANELYLKRLIVGGFEWVYEFSRNFRNEGMDRTHNPEFTVLEFYVAYKDYLWMMNQTEALLEKVCIDTNGSAEVDFQGNHISFKAPYQRITMYEAIEKYTGIDISQMDEVKLRQICADIQVKIDPTMGKGKIIDEIFSEKCEKHMIQPTFIIDYPIEMSPLTKKHRSKSGLVERFELYVNGKEIANAYSELNDPIDQRERFEEQIKLMERGDDEAMFIDHDFLRALEYGMPPTAGIGIGIDRLAMLLTNQNSIQDVLLFPQMKPEKLS